MPSESLLCKGGVFDGLTVFAPGDSIIYWAGANRLEPNGPMTAPKQIRDAEGFYMRGSIKIGRSSTRDCLVWFPFRRESDA
jgi:hypothetical protein